MGRRGGETRDTNNLRVAALQVLAKVSELHSISTRVRGIVLGLTDEFHSISRCFIVIFLSDHNISQYLAVFCCVTSLLGVSQYFNPNTSTCTCNSILLIPFDSGVLEELSELMACHSAGMWEEETTNILEPSGEAMLNGETTRARRVRSGMEIGDVDGVDCFCPEGLSWDIVELEIDICVFQSYVALRTFGHGSRPKRRMSSLQAIRQPKILDVFGSQLPFEFV